MKQPAMTAAFLLFFWGIGFFSGMSAVDAASADIGESQRRLREIETRINKNYRQLRGQVARERTLRQDLEDVEREVSVLVERMAQEELKAAALLEEIKSQEAEIGLKEAAFKRTENDLRERLKAIYKGDETTFLQVFFSSQSPETAMENLLFMGKVVQRDHELLSGYRSERQRLEESLRRMAILRKSQEKVLEELKGNKREMEKAQQLKKRLLTQVAEEKRRLQQKIADLKGRAKELGELILRLEQEKKEEVAAGGGNFADQKGKLMWPLQGAIRIGFGTRKHPELETLYESQGIDIEAAGEKAVAAVWHGKVVFAKAFRGYGNLLIVNHGDGFHTLYAQAARLQKQVGEMVRKGETVVYSSPEGNRSIYFEIRHRGVPQDPTQWLFKK